MAGGGRKLRIRAVLAKIESAYGTDPTPAAATDAIETVDARIQPLVADIAEHAVDRGSMGNYLATLINKRVVITFRVAAAGSGTAGTAPAWGVLMRGCSMSETVNASTDVRYAPIDTSQESITIYFWQDGSRHAIVGCRGTWGVSFDPSGGFPYFEFTFTGVYAAPTAVANPSLTLSAFQAPLEVNNANTVVTMHGETVAMVSCSLAVNNEIVPRDVPGAAEILSTGRAPGGNIEIDAVPLGTKNWFSAVTNLAEAELNIEHGTTGGNIVEFDADNCQLESIDYGDSSGILTHPFSLRLLPDSGGGGDLEVVAK
jgi:hypothetical protein